MTTKPKAKKFRIRRNTPNGAEAAAGPSEAQVRPVQPQQAPAPQAPAAGQPQTAPVGGTRRVTMKRPAPGGEAVQTPAPAQQPIQQPVQTQPQTAPSSASMSPEQQIDAIRREGLTGRQLRMARRIAQKHGLAATSDFDAVRLLRQNGIDPFHRTNMLELVAQNDAPAAQPPAPNQKVQLPQTVPMEQNNLPSTETISPMDRRANEITTIQQNIAKRRRRKIMLLFTRLAAFVMLPTILTGWYFFNVATPMYATKAEFLIIQADGQGGSQLGGLLSGTQFATNQDSIATQSYLQSKDAMLRLDQDAGFKAHFSQDWVDPIQRLDANPSNEDAFKVYKKNVKIGYDPTEGVIRMEVIAADPNISSNFAERLITYAEERVDDLSRRKREDQMREASISLERAKEERREAQAALVALQEGTVLDPEGLIASLRSQITNVETQLNEKRIQLQALLDNRRPNEARLEGVQGDIRRLDNLLTELRGKMTDATEGEASLALQTARIQMAQADLATADLFLQSALQNEKQTELEANRQVRYLTTSVKPVPSEDASYPKSFENTALAFLIFSGIYLMISLTASILREQVSS